MMNMRIYSQLLVGALVSLSGTAALAQADPFLVVGVRQSGPPESARDTYDLNEGIPKQFASGLESAGYSVAVINDADMSARIRDCGSSDCLQGLPPRGAVSLVAQVSVEIHRSAKRGRDYTVFVTLARTAPDRQLWREKHACRNCNVDAAKHLAFLIGALLATEIAKSPPPPATASASSPPTPVTPTLAPLPVAASPGPIAAQPASRPARTGAGLPRYVPWIGMGVGVLTMAAGAYLWHVNERPSCDLTDGQKRCPERYDTGTIGSALFVTGGVVALLGVVGLVVFSPTTDTTVSVSPSGLKLSGTFP